MAYTVKELAKISGVSVRTLHWYDEIGLLKPFSKGANNYRYYEEQQLLRLQQILFFKELGFALNDIQRLLSQNDFDNIRALNAHRKILEDEIVRKNDLITTIDKTIQHLRGKEAMTDKELYYGFDKKLPKSNQYTCIARGTPAEKMLEHFKKDDVIWSDQEWSDFKNEVDMLDKAIAKLISKNAKPESEEVQALIQIHYELQSNFFNLTHDAYLALIHMYEDDDATIKTFFEAYHPKMQKFICEAMRHYASKIL
jgi:DNA-binding transcriptional MerR regulator